MFQVYFVRIYFQTYRIILAQKKRLDQDPFGAWERPDWRLRLERRKELEILMSKEIFQCPTLHFGGLICDRSVLLKPGHLYSGCRAVNRKSHPQQLHIAFPSLLLVQNGNLVHIYDLTNLGLCLLDHHNPGGQKISYPYSYVLIFIKNILIVQSIIIGGTVFI